MKKGLMLILALFLISVLPVLAQAPSPTPSGIIRIQPEEPIFLSSDVWYPGLTISRTVEIFNDDDQDRQLGFRGENLTPAGSLSEVLYLSLINQDNVPLYGSGPTISLKEFVTQGEIELDEIIPAHSSRTLTVSVTMDPNADNNYQNLTEQIDFIFGFLAPELSPTPTPTPTPSGGGVLGTTAATTGVGAGVGGPACSASSPSAPTNLLAVSAGPGQILLSWQPPATGTVTHYSILYGPTSGDYLYGNHNVGLTTSYLVAGLTPGGTYYFVVFANNDCAASGYSNEANAVAGGGLVAGAAIGAGPAPGFEVLGEATQPGQIAGGIATEAGEVAGVRTGKQFSLWKTIAFFLVFLLLGLIWWRRWRKRG